MLLQQGNAGAGLDQGVTAVLGGDQLFAEDALVGHGLVVIHGLLKIHVLAGGPLGQDFLAEGLEFALGDAFILNIHQGSAPFS